MSDKRLKGFKKITTTKLPGITAKTDSGDSLNEHLDKRSLGCICTDSTGMKADSAFFG